MPEENLDPATSNDETSETPTPEFDRTQATQMNIPPRLPVPDPDEPIQIPPQPEPIKIDPDHPDRSAIPPDGTQVIAPTKEPVKPGEKPKVFKPPPVKRAPEPLG